MPKTINLKKKLQEKSKHRLEERSLLCHPDDFFKYIQY